MVHSLLQDDEVDLTYDEKYYKDDKHMTKETWDKSSKAGQLKKKMDPATRKLQQYLITTPSEALPRFRHGRMNKLVCVDCCAPQVLASSRPIRF